MIMVVKIAVGSIPTIHQIYNPVVAEIDQRVPEEDEMLERYQPTGPNFLIGVYTKHIKITKDIRKR